MKTNAQTSIVFLALAVLSSLIAHTSAFVVSPRDKLSTYNDKDFSVLTKAYDITLGSTVNFTFVGQKCDITDIVVYRFETENLLNQFSQKKIGSVSSDIYGNSLNSLPCGDGDCTNSFSYTFPDDVNNHQPYFFQAKINGAHDKSSDAFMVYNKNDASALSVDITANSFKPSNKFTFGKDNETDAKFCYGKDMVLTFPDPASSPDITLKRYQGPSTGVGSGWESHKVDSSKYTASFDTKTGELVISDLKDGIDTDNYDFPYYVELDFGDTTVKSPLFFIYYC